MFEGVPEILAENDPSQLAKLLLRLVLVWRKLRNVRIELDETQFRVLLAIKRGKSTTQEIASYTRLDEEVVEGTVQQLQATVYRDDIRVVVLEGGKLATPF